MPLLRLSACLLFISLGICSAIAQPAQQQQEVMDLSLQQAIDYGLSHQATVQNALIDQKIAKQRVNEIGAALLPQINGAFELQDFIVRPTTVFPDFLSPAVYGVLIHENLVPLSHFPSSEGSIPVQFGTQYTATASGSISQIIFDPGYFLGLKAAKVYMALSKKMIDRTRIDAVEAITKAYYGVVINRQHKLLLEANVSRLQKLYDDTKAYNENGFAEKIDVDRVKVQLNNLKMEMEKVDQALQISDDLLKFQMGMLISSSIRVTDSLTFNQIEEAQKVDYNNRIEYAILQTQKQLYAMDVKRNQYAYSPSINAYGNFSGQALQNTFDFIGVRYYPTVLFGAKLNVPIFDGFAKKARIQQAKLTLQKANNDENNLKNLIDFQVTSANITYQNNYKTLEEQKQNMELAAEVSRVTQIKYKEGVGSNLEVTNAETDLRQAQSNYFDALYSLIIARTDLQKAEGTLVK